eukprot:CAMPEP_0170060484 /NCGR_PEP_ID=MMETSP0019_2-20121128/2406_1 /TAXON_ID=98059 /ORGANISM="Dinobryon sp., Strain UTEXLB2267" /LENGTH=239 /DNA_ID=CAMNT_0010266069 /DNA_START=150 /DNA_END=869 /DNA_ORIENTATION=-
MDDNERRITLEQNINIVNEKLQSAELMAEKAPQSVRLVAVSKTKPVSDILTLYEYGHRVFGENYFQELVEKSEKLPSDIQWHFIGHLQSSKAPKIIKEVPNLEVLETIDSLKLAGKLNQACESVGRRPLKVYIQVDTSGETTKSGVTESELPELALYIKEKCPFLHLSGLMTIGAPGDLICFDRLVSARESVAALLGLDVNELALSMGMSADFEEAILKGATSVRVGSTIFGERIYAKR